MSTNPKIATSAWKRSLWQPGGPHQAHDMSESPGSVLFADRKSKCGRQKELTKFITCRKSPALLFYWKKCLQLPGSPHRACTLSLNSRNAILANKMACGHREEPNQANSLWNSECGSNLSEIFGQTFQSQILLQHPTENTDLLRNYSIYSPAKTFPCISLPNAGTGRGEGEILYKIIAAGRYPKTTST